MTVKELKKLLSALPDGAKVGYVDENTWIYAEEVEYQQQDNTVEIR